MEDLKDSVVLVVDDNPRNLGVLFNYLSKFEFTILVAQDGKSAFRLLDEQIPDLILLDVMLPDTDGYDICRRLKIRDDTRDVPVIMVTALTELGDIERGVESGTDDFITKPVNRLELVTRVRSLLRVRHLQNELERTLAYLAELEQARNTDAQ